MHARRLTLDVGTLLAPVDRWPAPICNRALRTCKLQDDSCSFARAPSDTLHTFRTSPCTLHAPPTSYRTPHTAAVLPLTRKTIHNTRCVLLQTAHHPRGIRHCACHARRQRWKVAGRWRHGKQQCCTSWCTQWPFSLSPNEGMRQQSTCGPPVLLCSLAASMVRAAASLLFSSVMSLLSPSTHFSFAMHGLLHLALSVCCA